MKRRQRTPAAPTFRTILARQAQSLGVPTDALERALILGQVAGLLVEHPKFRRVIAFKGGAVMRLIDRSPRLSRDLDSAELRGHPIQRRWVREALSTRKAKRAVLGVSDIVRQSPKSLGFLVRCRSISGGTDMPITLTVNWEEPIELEPEWQSFNLPGGDPIRIPVLHRVERAAEKVRAFLDRGEANDAYDLYWYSTRVLDANDWKRLPGVLRAKLRVLRHAVGDELHKRFETMRSNAATQWQIGQGIVVVENPPNWDAVNRQLSAFKKLVPQKRPKPTS